MDHSAIPNWNAVGVIPPFTGNAVGTDRSPYTVSISDVILRFGTSPERRSILRGFLKFRETLRDAGVRSGFQWLNGSFTENKEVLEAGPPNDIDVVTFHGEMEGDASESILERILDRNAVKTEFHVDHYFVDLSIPSRELVYWATYWSSVWSHRRSMQWKGFLEVDLDSCNDANASVILAQLESEGD